MTITPETIAELRGLLDAATQRPWMVDDEGDDVAVIVDEGDDFSFIQVTADLHQGDDGLTDARLIVAAVNALPALLDAVVEVEPLRGWVEELKGERDSVYASMTRAHVDNAALRANLAEVTAERDALAASVARVRVALDSHPDPTRYQYASKGPISCGWKSALVDVHRALLPQRPES